VHAGFPAWKWEPAARVQVEYPGSGRGVKPRQEHAPGPPSAPGLDTARRRWDGQWYVDRIADRWII